MKKSVSFVLATVIMIRDGDEEIMLEVWTIVKESVNRL
jgi:hypothetical protein